MPKVSVVVPVYNVEPYLARCLDSLINQTLSDIEIICVNDCSPDNSLKILNQYAAQDTRITIINHEKNLKLAGARNSALRVSTGEYVAFIDSDDYIAEDFLEKLYNLAERENADIAKGACKILSAGDVASGIISNNAEIEKNKYNFQFFLWTAIFRRSVLCKYDIKFAVDTIVFQMRAVHSANKIATTNDAIYYYCRQDDSNDSPVFSLEKWQSLNIRGADLVLDFINSIPIEKENYLLLAKYLILPLPLHGYERLAENDIPKGMEIFSNILLRFHEKIKYKAELDQSFTYIHKHVKEHAKLHDPLQIRRIAKRSVNTDPAMNFVVAEYSGKFTSNIGDSIQQIAITHALQTVFPDIPINFVERDMWCKYRGGGLSVMQGWFGYTDSFPPRYTLPLWIGTHYTDKMRKFIKRVADVNHNLFGHIGFGARDLETLQFAQTIDSKAYLSRCYTLTLPRRVLTPPNNGKVFLVNIPSAWEEYIPSTLLDGAVRVTHGVPDVSEAKDRAKYASTLLERYRDEARLVITCKVHSASPCIAMGIPVVAIAENSEWWERISFLDDLITINSQDDLKKGLIDWNPFVPDIENLKNLMLENLRLSVSAAQGKKIDVDDLSSIRKQIAGIQ